MGETADGGTADGGDSRWGRQLMGGGQLMGETADEVGDS